MPVDLTKTPPVQDPATLSMQDLEALLAARKAENKGATDAAGRALIESALNLLPRRTFKTGSEGIFYKGSLTLDPGTLHLNTKGYTITLTIVDRDTVIKTEG